MSRSAIGVLSQPLPSAESWSPLVSWCSPGCTLSAETPRLLAEVAHRGVRVSRLSPRRPPEAMQVLRGHREGGPLGTRGVRVPGEQMPSTSWRLPWPSRSSGGVNPGRERETCFNNTGRPALFSRELISRCKINGFYHLGLLWVGFWAQQASDGSGALGF